MSPRKRVHRLGDIALVRVAEFVGRCIVEPARRCDLDELYRNVAFIRSDVCVCIPAAMYDEYAVIVLKTISRAIDSAEISEAFLHEFMASPIMTIIDRLSTVKNYPEVSLQLLLLVYMNLQQLKKLRNLEIDAYVMCELDFICRTFYPRSSINDGSIHWLENCDLQFLEELTCPEYFCDECTFSLLEDCSRLEVLSISDTYGYRDQTIVFSDLSRLSGLRELDISDFRFEFNDLLENLLSRNQQLETLFTSSNLEVFSKSKTILPALKHLHLGCKVMDSAILSTVATRFPNLTSLELFLAEGFDTSILTALSHLSSLSILTTTLPTEELWVLLREIGHIVVTLKIETPILRSDLFFIHEHCTNCENLDFICAGFNDLDPLFVPSFPKLKILHIEIMNLEMYWETEFRTDGCDNALCYLDFTEMPSLECMSYRNFEIPQTKLESMLLDSVNFPRLTRIIWPPIAQERIKHIQRFIKQRNLDVIFRAAKEGEWFG